MTPTEIILLANEKYPDGYLEQYFNTRTGRPKRGSGDTLAKFVVSEIFDTYDEDNSDEGQRVDAAAAIRRAAEQLLTVANHLSQPQPLCVKLGFDDMWNSHPQYPRCDWEVEVANRDTLLGYWEWVAHQLEDATASQS